jgi:hypothetical protein
VANKSELHVWAILVLFGRCMRGLSLIRRRLSPHHLNCFGIPSMMRQHMCSMVVRFSVDSLFIFFFFPFSSSIFIFAHSKFQSSFLICYSFRFDPFSFDYCLFYLKQFIKLNLFFNFIPLQLFHLSNFILILLTTIFLFEISS